MRILFEHTGVLPVLEYGGTERLLFWLMRELASRGHEVTLIGSPGCKLDGTGIRLIERNPGDWREQIPKGMDVAHLFNPPPEGIDLPLVVTIGGNGKPGERYHRNTVFVSRNHAHNHGSKSFVYNGIDLDEYPFLERKNVDWENFLFLAKAKWKVKNLTHCVSACKKTHKNLHIAGGRAWGWSRWIHSHGMVGQTKKIELLRQCDALLFPVRWNEPFGIAVIEAMAMGIPVIGSPYGSLSELITPETGIICKNLSELETALKERSRNFDSHGLRERVVKNFSIEKMADSYLGLYDRVIRGESLNPETPRTVSQRPSEELLPF